MSATTVDANFVPPSKPARPAKELPPRLWFPVTMAVLYWAFYFSGGKLSFDPGTIFFSRMGASALVLLLGSIWWWANGRIPLFDRFLGFMVFVVGLVVTPLLLTDKSINGFSMFLLGVPVVFTAAALGLVAARNASREARRFLVLGSMIVAFLGFTVIRMEGLEGNLDSNFAWRWTPTSEARFLAERESQPDAPPVELPQEPLVAQAGDWTEFRGPGRAGVVQAGDVATDWRADPPQLVWKHAVGPAWSSMIVVAGRLFTQEQRGEQEAVTCYDAATGAELWASEIKTRFEESVAGAGPRATPTFAEGRLYTFGAKGDLICLNATNGELLWQRRATEDSKAETPMWGFAGSPLVVDAVVVVFGGGPREGARKSLLAYDLATHELVWTADAGYGSFSSPQLVTIAGRRSVAFVGELGLQAFDPQSGKLVWQWGEKRDNEPHSLQPHVYSSTELGDRLYVASKAGIAEAKVAVADDQPQFETGWFSPDLKPDFNDFVIYQDHAYGFDRDIFACIDLKTGKRTWKGGRYGHGQVILLEDKARLLVLGEKGQAALLAADRQKFDQLGTFQAIAGKTWNHPVVADGHLYVRNAQEMACYDLRPREALSRRRERSKGKLTFAWFRHNKIEY